MNLLGFLRKPKTKSEVSIVLVDDERDFLESMAFWFRSQGYGVRTASGGHQALALVRKMKPDIVFLDIMMPQMDGIETLQGIRKVDKKIPVVMLTAYGSEENRLNAYKYGVNAIFDKSMDFCQAEHLINSFVRVVAKKKAGC